MDQLHRISLARARLVEAMPFIGHLALYLKPEVSSMVKTFQVWPDGTLYFNAEFVEKLTTSQVNGCLAHETLHVALLFWSRLQTREHDLFNLAHDHAINLILSELSPSDFQIPQPAPMNRDYIGKSAEEIYEILYKRRRNHVTPALGYECATAFAPAVIERESERWRARVADAVKHHEVVKGRGKLPESLIREIDPTAKPREGWRDEIADFVGYHARRTRRNPLRASRRGVEVEEIVPSLSPGADPVAVLLDTSCSISKTLLSKAVAEIVTISDRLQSPVRVIVVDSKVHRDVEIHDAADLIEHAVGGGGSNFIPAFDKLRLEGFKGAILAFTDGDIETPRSQPENVSEVLWIIGGNHHPPQPWGRVVRLAG